MKGHFFVALFLLAALVFAGHVSADAPRDGKFIFNLTNSDFDVDPNQTIKKGDPNKDWLVMFWASWCYSCSHPWEFYDEFAEKYGEELKIQIGQIDCEWNGRTCRRFDIRHLSAAFLLFFHEGRYIRYHGGPPHEKVATFIKGMRSFESALEARGAWTDVPAPFSLFGDLSYRTAYVWEESFAKNFRERPWYVPMLYILFLYAVLIFMKKMYDWTRPDRKKNAWGAKRAAPKLAFSKEKTV